MKHTRTTYKSNGSVSEWVMDYPSTFQSGSVVWLDGAWEVRRTRHAGFSGKMWCNQWMTRTPQTPSNFHALMCFSRRPTTLLIQLFNAMMLVQPATLLTLFACSLLATLDSLLFTTQVEKRNPPSNKISNNHQPTFSFTHTLKEIKIKSPMRKSEFHLWIRWWVSEIKFDI